MSSTFEVSLRVFGPESFYRWLYRSWRQKPGLSQGSRKTFYQAHKILASKGLISETALSESELEDEGFTE